VPAAWAVEPEGGDMVRREGGRVSAQQEGVVAPTLEPAGALPSGR
jgi:hypothetical protein